MNITAPATVRAKPLKLAPALPHIVELCAGVWLADCEGDPGRTLVEASAKVFPTKKAALRALVAARKFRPFRRAQIVAVKALKGD